MHNIYQLQHQQGIFWGGVGRGGDGGGLGGGGFNEDILTGGDWIHIGPSWTETKEEFFPSRATAGGSGADASVDKPAPGRVTASWLHIVFVACGIHI